MTLFSRLNEETRTGQELQAELQAVRRQNVELEKQLGRQALEQLSGSKTGEPELSQREKV